MKIKLKFRQLTAYFSPNKPILADNESLQVELPTNKHFSNKVIIVCNDKTYVAENNTVIIPRADLQEINVCEVQERDCFTDKILQRFVTENLYVITAQKGDTSRLVSERVFYQQVLIALSDQIKSLKTQIGNLSEKEDKTEQRIESLEKGKFTLFKFTKGE